MFQIFDFSSKCILGCGLAFAMLVRLGSAEAQISWNETVLYSFCTQNLCADGQYPQSGVIEDSAGNLYGTTINGGGNGYDGTVFELTPAQQTPWPEQYLSLGHNGDNFSEPVDLIFDANCNQNQSCTLDGASSGFSGGNPNVGGVFSLTGTGPVSGWTEGWGFAFQGNGNDGAHPNGVIKVNGSLYGTTINGGCIYSNGNCSEFCAAGCGTVFEITPGGSERPLKIFCSAPRCTDGYWPQAALIADTSNNLYGTASRGGGTNCPGYGIGGCGTVFELSPPPRGQAGWAYCVLWSFQGGNDGANPAASLIVDSNGNLYGTTASGGSSQGYVNQGTVFELKPPAHVQKCQSQSLPWRETVLYSFSGTNGDGNTPVAGVIMDSNGYIYGTTEGGGLFSSGCSGGPGGCGTVFELTPAGQGQKQWNETVIYLFCSQGGENCTDGARPTAPLIIDSHGYLYGTTYIGGAQEQGTVFELAPPSG